MTTYKRSEKPITISIPVLLCCIFTIEPHNKLFKILNFKRELYLNSDVKNENSIFLNLHNETLANELYKILNRPALRQMAHNLLKPILLQPNGLQKNNDNKTLLQRYLKKFKYLYRRYFCKYTKQNQFITDKDLNYFAIQTLFLIVGV